MKFTNTDCVQIYEIISHPEKMQMIRQVCRGGLWYRVVFAIASIL